MTIRRFSSRTHQRDKTFLMDHLKGARSYKRIVGFFTSSLSGWLTNGWKTYE